MSFMKPKRIGELSPIDESHFKTPSQTSFSESAGVRSFLPKRLSELSPLSSDDDDNPCNNAFLDDTANDSILEQNNPKSSEFKENKNYGNSDFKLNKIDEESPENDDRRDSASRKLTFDYELGEKQASLHNESESSNITNTAVHMYVEKSNESASKHNNLGPHNVHEASNFNRTKPLDFSKTDVKSDISTYDLCTPKIPTKIDLANINRSQQQPTDIIDETPYKTFQMPTTSVQRHQSNSHHRSILSSAGQRKTFRTQIENEFKSQKVLFTTPSVSRPTIKKMSNLTLDDSLQCYQSSPMVNQSIQLSPVKEERLGTNIKTATLPILNESVTKAIDETAEVKLMKVEEPQKITTKSNDEDKILNINGKDFIIRERIGQGGSSTVFLAEHKGTKLECALKVVDLHADPALVEGYIKEVKILASIQDKKNVIRLYEYSLVKSESLLYLVMEKGESDLRKVLQSYTAPLPLYTLMKYWHQMLQAVNYIHKNDVIHSDLKPENFLVVRGRLKLIDFGISSKMAVDATSIIKFSQVGTFNYISPESLMDTSTGNSPISQKRQTKIKISPKSDVWSLGCILYLLIYQKTPFAHIKNIYAKIQAIISSDNHIGFAPLPNYYPAMLLEMVKLCLIHNPKERASVADLLNFPINMVIEIDE